MSARTISALHPKLFVITVVLIGLTALLPAAGDTGTSESDSFFPLSKGNVWTYEGPVTWTKGNGKPQTATVTVTMEVLETYARDHVFAALISGHPSDTAMYEPGEKRDHSLIVRVGPCWYYLVSGADRISSITRRIADPEDALFELVEQMDLWLMNPLVPGCLYGETEQISRTDRSYCWQVESAADVDIRPWQPDRSGAARKYTLGYLARNSHQQMEFVPGLGMVGYLSVHHGTPFETKMKLKSCRLLSSSGTSTPSPAPAEPPVVAPVEKGISLEAALKLAQDFVKSGKFDLSGQHLGSITRQMDRQKKQPYWHIQWQWDLPRMGGEFGVAVFNDGSVAERRCGP